ncbi:MAG: arginine repressor [Ruminococcaceae bacterium]|nr:arginine repressor [Oscillospiraceae bacterium]
MKINRQNKILQIISEQSIETQDELLEKLKEAGYSVTQATVSRDIKELRLVKTSGAGGKYRYVASQPDTPDISSKFYTLFSDSVASVDYGQNIVCIKCHVGMAQAVCASMDAIRFENIVGTLAGDDTIFVLCRSEAAATSLVNELRNIINR